jgi:aminopeptidase
MPGGEVFYGPVEDSAEGYITFTAPIVRNAAVIKDVRLEFRKGKVVSMSARKNQALLHSLLSLPGADIIGEFAVGTNYKIKKYAKNISFDEKIGGKFHIALGNSYPFLLWHGGGLNVSPLHWDILCDLRKRGKNPGGKMYVDGQLVQENGEWVFDMEQSEQPFMPEGHVLQEEV